MSLSQKPVSETVMPHYLVREEVWALDDQVNQRPLSSAYSFAGDYLGNPDHAERLVREYGITYFEKIEPEHCVCSIGFSPRDQKWYGWSHRAIHGYGIGEVVEPGTPPVVDFEAGGATHGILPSFKIKTLDDAKRVATAFATAVS